jgi:hypothetical protein
VDFEVGSSRTGHIPQSLTLYPPSKPPIKTIQRHATLVQIPV